MTKRDENAPDTPDAPDDLLPPDTETTTDKIIDVGDELDEPIMDEQERAEFIDFLTNSPTALAINARYGALDMNAPDVLPGKDCDCLACRSYREARGDALTSIEARAQSMVASPDSSVAATPPALPAEYEGAEHTANVIRRIGRGWLPPDRLEHAVALTLGRRARVLEIAEAIVNHYKLAEHGCSDCASEHDGEGWVKTCTGAGLCGRDPLTHQQDDFGRPLGQAGWSLQTAQAVMAARADEVRTEVGLGHDGRAARTLNERLADEANALPRKRSEPTTALTLAQIFAPDPLWVPLLPLTFPTDGPRQ